MVLHVLCCTTNGNIGHSPEIFHVHLLNPSLITHGIMQYIFICSFIKQHLVHSAWKKKLGLIVTYYFIIKILLGSYEFHLKLGEKIKEILWRLKHGNLADFILHIFYIHFNINLTLSSVAETNYIFWKNVKW